MSTEVLVCISHEEGPEANSPIPSSKACRSQMPCCQHVFCLHDQGLLEAPSGCLPGVADDWSNKTVVGFFPCLAGLVRCLLLSRGAADWTIRTLPFLAWVTKLKSAHVVVKLHSKALPCGFLSSGLCSYWASTGAEGSSFSERLWSLQDMEIIKPCWGWAGVWKCVSSFLSSTDKAAEGGRCMLFFDGEWLWLLGFAPKSVLSVW